jgi:hypothetical protein
MRTRSKLVLTALTAVLALAITVGSASANQLSVSEDEADITWDGLSFNAGGIVITCPVTLLGTFDDRIIDKEKQREGEIDHAVVGDPCSGGDATVLEETLPWDVTYLGFTGTLPNITNIELLLIGASFEITDGIFATCLARTTAENPAVGVAEVDSNGQVTTVTADPDPQIPLTGGGLCDDIGEGGFEGTGDVEDRNGGLLFVDLI